MGESFSTALLAAAIGSSLVSVCFFVWYLWALSRLFPQLGLPAWEGWVPFLNQWRLLQRAGLPGWLVLVGLVCFGIVPVIALIVGAHRLNREAGLGSGMTVLAALIAPLWAMILTQRLAEQRPTLATVSERYLPEAEPPALNSAWAPQGGYVSGPPPPPAWSPPPAPGARPEVRVPEGGEGNVAAPPAHPAARAVAPAPLAAPAPVPPPPPAAVSPAPTPDGWQEAAAGSALDDEDDHTIINAPAEEEDHTIIVQRTPRIEWVLEINGEDYPLSADTTIGRNPSPVAGSTLLPVNDPTRVLSKSHARFRLEGSTWSVEDLGSTNGTALLHDDGREEELDANSAVEATERLLLGTLPARIRRKEGDGAP